MKKGVEEGGCIPVTERARMPGVPAVVWTVEGFSGDAPCSLGTLLKPVSSLHPFLGPFPGAVSWCSFPGSLIFFWPWGFQHQISLLISQRLHQGLLPAMRS